MSRKYPIKVAEGIFKYLEIDLIYFIELTTFLQKITGWEALEILKLMRADEFPDGHFAINSNGLPDLAWTREEIGKYLSEWRKRQ